MTDIFQKFPELAGATIAFGLKAQGRLDLVERMVLDGKSWDEIGAAIGWSGDAVERHWNWHLEDLAGSELHDQGAPQP